MSGDLFDELDVKLDPEQRDDIYIVVTHDLGVKRRVRPA